MSTIVSPAEVHPSRGLQVALWSAQLMLAITFGTAGVMKLSLPIAELGQQLPWAADVPAALVRFIGLSEAAAALGLILPAVTRILPWLTPLAGAGLTAIMVLAGGFHLLRGESEALPMNLGLGLIAAFVAWGRTWKAPISAR